LKLIERYLEKVLFASRWLLAPFYVVLVLSLAVMVVKIIQLFIEGIPHALEATESGVILTVLGFIDLTLTGSLLVIVIFSGYENFVSRIDETQHKDWPEWMGKIDFTGLKLKLMSSIVAISAIQLLRAFMDLKETSDRDLAWSVGIHLVFVVSALLLALTDYYSANEHKSKEQ
jgi:uncharacterized protein (TIGR00645 family)